jgi:hypothetical protein
MADDAERLKDKSRDKTRLSSAELSPLLPPKVCAFLDGDLRVKMFAGAKDLPQDKPLVSADTAMGSLKITRSTSDVTIAYAYMKRLETLKEMLVGASDLNALRQRVKQRKERIGEVFQQNMAKVFTDQRPLEKTYRELDTFFYEAALSQGEGVSFVSIVNAHAGKHFNELMDPQTGLATRLPNKENFDMKGLTGLIVIPDWVGSEAKLVKYGELAQQSMAHLFVGFPDVSLEEAHEMFEVGGVFAELKSTDFVKQYISLVGNSLRIRKANRYENELGDLFLNPASILGGKVYKGDVKEGIHIAQANKQHAVRIPTSDGSELKMKWDIRGGTQMKFNKAIIPLVWNEGIVFWGVDTLYQAGGQGDTGLDQYSVKRCDEYLAKVILHYLNGEIFKENTQGTRSAVYSSLYRFLMANTGTGKMLIEGKVLGVECMKDALGNEDPQRLDIRIFAKYPNAIRQMNLYLVSTEDHQWKQGDGK